MGQCCLVLSGYAYILVRNYRTYKYTIRTYIGFCFLQNELELLIAGQYKQITDRVRRLSCLLRWQLARSLYTHVERGMRDFQQYALFDNFVGVTASLTYVRQLFGGNLNMNFVA